MLYNIEYVNNVISKKNEKSYRVLWRNAGNQGLLWLFIVAAKQKKKPYLIGRDSIVYFFIYICPAKASESSTTK